MSYRQQHQKLWTTDNVLDDGRVVDVGGSPGPSASALIDLHRIRSKGLRWFKLGAGVTGILAVGLTIIFLWKSTQLSAQAIGPVLLSYASLGSSIAMVVLTFGLLMATWRYASLTAVMVQEIRSGRQYESEPQVTMSLWPWLQADTNPETVSDYVSRVYIRNVGTVMALDPSLHYDMIDWDSGRHRGGVMSVGPGTEVGALRPGEQVVLDWWCTKETFELYGSNNSHSNPFVTLRLRYRDSWNRPCSLTQDYRVDGNEAPFLLTLSSEFVATPTQPRWRKSRDGRGFWVSA